MNRFHRQLRQLREKCPIPQDAGGSYQEVHHVGLVVPQRLHRVEDVHRPLVPEHLTHDADGAESPTTASPVPVGREIRWSRLPSRCLLPRRPSPGQQVTEEGLRSQGDAPLGPILPIKANGVNEPQSRAHGPPDGRRPSGGTFCSPSFASALDYIIGYSILSVFIQRAHRRKFPVNKHGI